MPGLHALMHEDDKTRLRCEQVPCCAACSLNKAAIDAVLHEICFTARIAHQTSG